MVDLTGVLVDMSKMSETGRSLMMAIHDLSKDENSRLMALITAIDNCRQEVKGYSIAVAAAASAALMTNSLGPSISHMSGKELEVATKGATGEQVEYLIGEIMDAIKVFVIASVKQEMSKGTFL